jgi:transposase
MIPGTFESEITKIPPMDEVLRRHSRFSLAKILACLKTKIVKRSDQAKGFVRLPKRWIVKRTIAWLNRCRRLAKDWENLNRNALAFLKLASIRLMLRKLCNP